MQNLGECQGKAERRQPPAVFECSKKRDRIHVEAPVDSQKSGQKIPPKKLVYSTNQLKNSRCPVVILPSENLLVQSPRFLVDSGSEVNIIKESALKRGQSLDANEIYNLTGITKESILTKGSTHIEFGEVSCKFNVVDSTFPIY